jgi:hypothetical protein
MITPAVLISRVNGGRHSLGTSDRDEAIQRLPALDRRRAEVLGLVPQSEPTNSAPKPMPLDAQVHPLRVQIHATIVSVLAVVESHHDPPC